MKEFAYGHPIDSKIDEKNIRKLIYVFFKVNIIKKKVMINGILKQKTIFSFKRPFGFGGDKIAYPDDIEKKFPSQTLYVLRHYDYKDNKNPLFIADSQALTRDLQNLDEVYLYEYTYIFDIDFTYCFFVTDSYKEINNRTIAILKLFKPI